MRARRAASGSGCFAYEPLTDAPHGPVEMRPRDVQSEFRAAPQYVVCAGRPFMIAQIVQLGFIQAGRESFAEVGERLRLANKIT